jgi:predicted  nucleic acid-binding Zn-ribbon protein
VKTPEPPKEARGGRIVMIDDNKHFTALDLARYNLAQMKMQSALQSVGLKEYEIKNTNLEWGRLVQEFEKKMGHLTKEREQLSSFVKAEEKDLLELQSELGDAYDIVFDQSLAYDDKTGKIVVLEQKTDPAVPKE